MCIRDRYKSLSAMKAGAKRLGWEFRTGQKTYAWFGRFVGDTPMPEGLTVDDLGKCDHAIRVPGAKYEIGICKVAGGYELRYDYFKPGGLNPEMLGKFSQAYAAEQLKSKAPMFGKRVVSEKVHTNGYVELELEGGTSW